MPPEEAPHPFGEYHLLEKIATGGMAEVWRARAYGMAGFEKILVIKRVLDHLATDEEFIRLFIDEARIAVQLLHVNIVQVFDLGEVDGSYYMAMEYVHGLDLARLRSRARAMGPFPTTLALFIGCEVLKALDFAHQRADEQGSPLRIVHCDISPQNILISYAGEVKITDFGISRAAFQASTAHDVIRGKYAYMSPEQVEARTLDGRSDVFSLAIVLFELITGRRLFKGKNRDETLARVRRAEVPSLRTFRPEISESLERIVHRGLARNRDDRYDTAGQMLDALRMLMVREEHRATNNDLALYVKNVLEIAEDGDPHRGRAPAPAEPIAVVVVSMEANPPPRTLASPNQSLEAMTETWLRHLESTGGEVWEHGAGSLLVVWRAGGGLPEALSEAIRTSETLRQITQKAGYRPSIGVVPGVAHITPSTGRPPVGWALSGPFYLARWMMNLSAHRGRVLLTEVGARQITTARTRLLGRISIQGDRYIHLYELGNPAP